MICLNCFFFRRVKNCDDITDISSGHKTPDRDNMQHLTSTFYNPPSSSHHQYLNSTSVSRLLDDVNKHPRDFSNCPDHEEICSESDTSMASIQTELFKISPIKVKDAELHLFKTKCLIQQDSTLDNASININKYQSIESDINCTDAIDDDSSFSGNFSLFLGYLCNLSTYVIKYSY